MKKQKFTLTKNHIKLLQRMYVSWYNCEYGAPCIDPKRPYGNSDVEEDIREILPNIPLNDEKCLEIHKETETALQIVLTTGTFKPGIYECDEYDTNWKLKK